MLRLFSSFASWKNGPIGNLKWAFSCQGRKERAVPEIWMDREWIHQTSWVPHLGFYDLLRLAQTVCLNQPHLDQQVFITSNASDLAVGAQLCQGFDGVRTIVASFSRKLIQS